MPNNIERVPLVADGKKKVHKVTLKERLTSCRWHVGYVICITLACTMLLRMNMTIVIVCMTPPNITTFAVVNGTNITVADSYMKYYVEWDSAMEGLLISGTYIGQVSTALFFGAMSGRYSRKYIIAIMVLIMAIATAITPGFVFISDYLVLALRIIVGMATSGLEPCATQVMSDWAPLEERAQMMVLTETARSIGGMANYILAGLLCAIPILGGWPFIFFVFGGINIMVLTLWAFMVYDNPNVHPRITASERDYINLHRAPVVNEKKLRIPWVQLLTSKAVWGCVLGFLNYGFLFMVLSMCIPLYFEQVLELNPTLNGIVSSLPFIGRIFGSIMFGYIADWVFSKKWLSITHVRKVFQLTGSVGAAPFLIWISFLGKDDAILAVVLLIIFWFIVTAMNSGFRANFADVAPRFAGLLNGICLCLNSFVSIFVPNLITAITKNGTAEEWRVVFFGCVGVSLVGAAMFLLLASGEEQEWAKDPTFTRDVEIKVTGNENAVFENDYGVSIKEETPLKTSYKRTHT